MRDLTKKTEQLGMHPSTASARLLKDILWNLIVETDKDTCCKCGEAMCRSTFSIEHVVPWLDSENPSGLFFDMENIAFSHLKCNISTARKPHKRHDCEATRHRSNSKSHWQSLGKEEQKRRRREKYLKYGC